MLVQAGLVAERDGGKAAPTRCVADRDRAGVACADFPEQRASISAAVLLLIGSALLWRPGKSPVLLFVFGFQWLQISTGIFYASWLGLNMNEFSRTHGDMQTAATLSLIGLLLLSCSMRLGAGASRPKDKEIARLSVAAASNERLVRALRCCLFRWPFCSR